MAPSEGKAINMGQGALAGAAVLGVGALAYYGAGLSGEMGAAEKSVMWPQYVKDRIRDTYMYFGGSVLATAGTAVAAFRTPAVMNLVSRGGFIAMGVSIAAMIGSGMVARSIPYQPGTLGTKQLAWLAHCAVIGAVIAPATSSSTWEAPWPWDLELCSAPALALPSSRRRLLWELVSTLSPSTEVSSCSGPSYCTTLRRSSTRQRGIPWDMERHTLILSTPAWEFTWTPSTSLSGLLQSWVEEAGGSKSEDRIVDFL